MLMLMRAAALENAVVDLGIERVDAARSSSDCFVMVTVCRQRRCASASYC